MRRKTVDNFLVEVSNKTVRGKRKFQKPWIIRNVYCTSAYTVKPPQFLIIVNRKTRRVDELLYRAVVRYSRFNSFTLVLRIGVGIGQRSF